MSFPQGAGTSSDPGYFSSVGRVLSLEQFQAFVLVSAFSAKPSGFYPNLPSFKTPPYCVQCHLAEVSNIKFTSSQKCPVSMPDPELCLPSVTIHSWGTPTTCFLSYALNCEGLQDCGPHIELQHGGKSGNMLTVRLTFLQGFGAGIRWQVN